MREKMEIPAFATEAEEARWWSTQEDRIADALEEASASGELGRGTAIHRVALPTTTIRLDPKDIERARIQAKRKGLRYQTYLKMLLHEALQAHENAG